MRGLKWIVNEWGWGLQGEITEVKHLTVLFSNVSLLKRCVSTMGHFPPPSCALSEHIVVDYPQLRACGLTQHFQNGLMEWQCGECESVNDGVMVTGHGDGLTWSILCTTADLCSVLRRVSEPRWARSVSLLTCLSQEVRANAIHH